MQIRRCQESEIPAGTIEKITDCSLFGSIEFGCLWEAVGGKAVYWAVYNEGNVVALLPAVEFGIRPLRRLQSMPDGCYGRLFMAADSGIDKATVAAELQEALTEAGYSKVFLYDFYGWCPELRGFQVQECVTSLVDISSPEWEPPDKKIQSEIRKAEREGIKLRAFAPADLDRFMELMQLAESEHGRKPKYPRRFFEALATLAEADDRVQWLWCEHEGEAASSHINFIENDMLINWQVYFDRRFSFLKPNQYMLFRAAREIAGKGVKYLNLGASPDEADNLRTYKKKWGGVERVYSCRLWTSTLGKMI